MAFNFESVFERGSTVKIKFDRSSDPHDFTVAFVNEVGVAVRFARSTRFHPWHSVYSIEIQNERAS